MAIDNKEILFDYALACQSRAASIVGRREVFMGKAKFGIFGDGKEIAQLAMAKVFRNGDFRSGYYRDQTFMFAINELTIQQYFAQLYAHASIKADPASAGRMMNSHFGTRLLNEDGQWKNLTSLKNVISDVSPNASQMPRLLGLAYASKLYRNNPQLSSMIDFSINGNEIAFGTIGNAATSEGMFFETLNAAGVLQVPMLISVWDDGYGISVPEEYHTVKMSISKALSGFKRTELEHGLEILTVKGWDYLSLCEAYKKAEIICRLEHIPVLIHVTEMTQPQGHSTSGSHERYKSKQRLEWEEEYDCIKKMREWILKSKINSEEQLHEIEIEAQKKVKLQRDLAWQEFSNDVNKCHNEAINLLSEINRNDITCVSEILSQLQQVNNFSKLNGIRAVRQSLYSLNKVPYINKKPLITWLQKQQRISKEDYNSHLYSQSSQAAINVSRINPLVSFNSPWVDGKEILNACFDAILGRYPQSFAIGEDIGLIGDVNQSFVGLQQKYGLFKVTDTSIRECTIIGQGIGAAMRGLRPIVEIQYLDYLPYGLQIMMDDLATLQYRTKGGQKAPMIIRTRGHRLEGMWHSGSYMAGIINNIRGIYVLVPRNMTQAAGFYNTMMLSDDACIIIECLNAYRLKEQMPDNVSLFTVPLGEPEILRYGTDITIVTYGAMCNLTLEASVTLEKFDISCEVIDVQTLLPFDIKHSIVESLKKTNRVLFVDEDVPGGATAFMMQKVLEEQNGFQYLDSPPVTCTSQEHRPAYAADGNYFSKPNVEDIVDIVYDMIHAAMPSKFPIIY